MLLKRAKPRRLPPPKKNFRLRQNFKLQTISSGQFRMTKFEFKVAVHYGLWEKNHSIVNPYVSNVTRPSIMSNNADISYAQICKISTTQN